MPTKLLFVDDDPNLRLMLPAILAGEGFTVTSAGTVTEAVDLINREKFDVLLSDLNIGQPGDGFTVVSVMRRIQPEAVTFILTGYPDFESALRAIRSQVDDYLTKPADVPSLVAALKKRLANRRPSRFVPTRRAPELLLDKLEEIIARWLAAVSKHPDLRILSSADQVNNIPVILSGICAQVLHGKDELDAGTYKSAIDHGYARFRHSSRAEFIVLETRLLQREIAQVLQDNLLAIDLSTLVPDAMKIADLITAAVQESIRSFNQQQLAA